MSLGFVAHVPGLDSEARGKRLLQWASGCCSDFCFLEGEGFMGVLHRPTTHKKLRQLLVNNLRNWHKKGELPGYVPRHTNQRAWLVALAPAEYAKRAKATRAYSEKVVGAVLADMLGSVYAHIDAKAAEAQKASAACEHQRQKRVRHEKEWPVHLEWLEGNDPVRFAERTGPGGDVELTPALRAAVDEARRAKVRRVR
jgi:hypothetical protein